MSREFPDWVDPVKAAQSRREVHATVPLKRLRRLAGLLAADEGEAEFHLAFSFDEQGQVCVHSHVSAEPWLVCQRTLEPYRQRLSGESTVGIVTDENMIDALPDDYEPWVCPNGRLELADLVAEELILALPLVPRSPDSEPLEAPERPGRQRPFAVLAELKRES